MAVVLVVVALCPLPSSLLKKILAVISLVVCAPGYLLNQKLLVVSVVRGNNCEQMGGIGKMLSM